MRGESNLVLARFGLRTGRLERRLTYIKQSLYNHIVMTQLLPVLKALADPTRLRIARLVSQIEMAVGELAVLLNQSQPRISRHVRILDEAAIVERRKEGAWVFLRPGAAFADLPLADLMAAGAEYGEAAMEADRHMVAKLRGERAAQAAAWFDSHAAQWDRMRALYIAEAEVETGIKAMVHALPINHLIDIGTGTGRMIELLGRDATRIIGIDKSAEMLRLARAKLSSSAIAAFSDPAQVDLRIGDFNDLPLADGQADFAVLHQVLHFAQHPETVVAEAARVLAAGGHLLVADFAPHDREELRRDFAHARLGFDDASLKTWFAQHGLRIVRDSSLHGGALTVRLWLAQKIA